MCTWQSCCAMYFAVVHSVCQLWIVFAVVQYFPLPSQLFYGRIMLFSLKTAKYLLTAWGSYYLSRHSWPSPPMFLSIAFFLSFFLLPFWVSLSVFRARKLCLLKSLFLDKKLYRIDSLIPTLIIFILRWRWRWRLHFFCWQSKRAQHLLHWMGGCWLPCQMLTIDKRLF